MGFVPRYTRKILRIRKYDRDTHQLMNKWCYPVAPEITYEMAKQQCRFRTMFMKQDGEYKCDLVYFEEDITDEDILENEVGPKNYKMLEYLKMVEEGVLDEPY